MTRDQKAKRNEEIRELARSGLPQREIARRYNLHESQVSRIVNNKSGKTN